MEFRSTKKDSEEPTAGYFSGEVVDAIALEKALDRINSWVMRHRKLSDEKRIFIRENDGNFIVRFKVRNRYFMANEIEQISSRGPVSDEILELFESKIWLSATNGHLNIYNIESGCVVDAVIGTKSFPLVRWYDKKESRFFAIVVTVVLLTIGLYLFFVL